MALLPDLCELDSSSSESTDDEDGGCGDFGNNSEDYVFHNPLSLFLPQAVPDVVDFER